MLSFINVLFFNDFNDLIKLFRLDAHEVDSLIKINRQTDS